MTEPITFMFTPDDLDEHVPTAVYVARDESGAVLYVGMTGSLAARFRAHRKADLWWPQAVSILVEMWPDRAQAASRETILIEQCDPPHNRVEKRRRGWAEARRQREDTLLRLRHDGWPLTRISSHLGIDYGAAVNVVTRLRKAGRL